MLDKQYLWANKYRPSNLSDFVFHSDLHKQQLTNMIVSGEIPHLLFSGVQGSGKTTLSKIIVNELNVDPADVLIINASDENSVDTIREKIIGFAASFPMGDFKVVQLEEMDYLSLNAQAVLRVPMEEYGDTCRVIGTCNYENKIMPALRSRFQHYHFNAPNIEEVSVYIAQILISEGIQFEIEVLEKYIAAAYPDIRKIVNMVQQSIIIVDDLKVLPEPTTSETGDYKFKLLELLEANDLKGLRELVCSTVTREEYEDIYKFLYHNVDKCPKFGSVEKYEGAIIMIANYLYRHGICADSEINFAALCIELSRI